ncbi:TonB-dependent receptor [Halioxenophilus sp. WMMB6]|uniref:TonB-dependent receptor n=1 Tax=Halioxenophilus sp. WMMB6 TaxID=3073815 RepID=UPI00295E63F6|nr:TonB-dependent receptor [Halioxenophilus sp. WMMB6]
MSVKPKLNLWLAASIAAAYSTLASGQESVAAETDSQNLSGVLDMEEIVVTAQRREERLVDVPISITALSAEDLISSGINSTADLERVTPGLELTFNGGFLQPAIRGVSSQGSSAGDSSNVAFYLDGVYMPSQPGQLMDLPDASQVQVLKGPQGTLYGQNATGGAIIIDTFAPSLDEQFGRFSASYGNYNDASLNGYFATPVSDSVAISIAASSQDRDGLRDDLVYGGEDKGLRSTVLRGKLLWAPTDDISLLFSAFQSERKDSSPYSGVAYDNRSIGYLAAAALPAGYPVPTPDEFETATSRPVDTDFKTRGASLRANFQLPMGTLSSTTSYTDATIDMDVDVDYTFFHLADVTVDLDQDFVVQELNFVSDLDGNWQFTSGLFYLDGREEYLPNTFSVAFNPLPAPAFSEADALMTPVQYTYGYIDKTIYAAYLELSYDLGERVKLVAGGRYSNEEQDVYSNWPDPRSSEIVASPFNTASFNQFTPRFTITYALNDTSNIYASYGEGFKSGFLNVAAADEHPVDPEQLSSFEVGYKGKVTKGLDVSTALFYYDYTDLQVARYEAPNYVTDNAAKASISGLEFNATWKPLKALSLAAGFTYLDATYDEFPGATANEWRPQQGGNVLVDFDASGYDLIRSPEFTGFINANYQRETNIGSFNLYTSAYYNDGYNLELSGAIAQDSYTLWDAELAFTPAKLPNLRLSLWGRNLSDEAVLQSLLETPFASGVSYGPPRTFGLRIDYNL